jgi:hypothetical protein
VSTSHCVQQSICYFLRLRIIAGVRLRRNNRQKLLQAVHTCQHPARHNAATESVPCKSRAQELSQLRPHHLVAGRQHNWPRHTRWQPALFPPFPCHRLSRARACGHHHRHHRHRHHRPHHRRRRLKLGLILRTSWPELRSIAPQAKERHTKVSAQQLGRADNECSKQELRQTRGAMLKSQTGCMWFCTQYTVFINLGPYL